MEHYSSYSQAQQVLRELLAKGKQAHIVCMHTIHSYWWEIKGGPDPYTWPEPKQAVDRGDSS